MAKLVIKLKKAQATRLKKHLAIEHPITRGRTFIENGKKTTKNKKRR